MRDLSHVSLACLLWSLLVSIDVVAHAADSRTAGAELAPAQELINKSGKWVRLAIRADGKQLAVADDNRTLQLFSADTLREERTFKVDFAPNKHVTDLVYLPDEQGLLVGSTDARRTVVHVDLAGKVIRTYEAANDITAQTKVAIFPAEKLLAIAWGDSGSLGLQARVSVWNYETGKLIKSHDGWPPPDALHFAADGKTIVFSAIGFPKLGDHEAPITSLKSRIYIANTKELSQVAEHGFDSRGVVYTNLSPDGNKLAISYKERKAPQSNEIWRTDRMTVLHNLKVNENIDSGVRVHLAFTPDSSHLITCEHLKDDALSIRVWNTSNGNLELTLKGHTAKTYCLDVALSPDSGQFFTIDNVGVLRCWDLSPLTKK